MSIWNRLKASLRAFSSGRYGMDNLSNAMLWTGVILLVLDMFLGTGFLQLLSMVFYGAVLFRMLSRNKVARLSENRKYLARVNGIQTKYRQAKARFNNRKEYKYVRCPGCKGWIRLPRGAGTVSVHCKACNHTFQQKA